MKKARRPARASQSDLRSTDLITDKAKFAESHDHMKEKIHVWDLAWFVYEKSRKPRKKAAVFFHIDGKISLEKGCLT